MVEQVSIDDDFFAMGGHSLTAMRLANYLESLLGREIPLRVLFDAPTVATLMERIEITSSLALPPEYYASAVSVTRNK